MSGDSRRASRRVRTSLGRDAKGPRSRKPSTAGRAAKAAARRDAILAAALEEFSARGFTSSRLEDVAKRADVGKGTIYLYFRDKDALFQELIRATLVPQVVAIEDVQLGDLPTRAIVSQFLNRFVTEIYGTRRRDVLRLMLTEGHRFPQLAEFYYREVVERAMAAIRAVMRRAQERGELPNDSVARFPQLLVAPALVGVMWSGLFAHVAPLDVAALMQAHIDLLFGAEGDA